MKQENGGVRNAPGGTEPWRMEPGGRQKKTGGVGLSEKEQEEKV